MAGLRAAVGAPLLLLALVSIGEAQIPLLVPGVRVRVTGPCLADLPSGPARCAVVVGRLRSWTPDSVIVQQESGGDRAVARRAARLVEVSDGIKSYKTLGALVGSGVGFGVGLAVAPGLAARCDSESSNDTGERVLGLFGCGVVGLSTVFVSTAAGAFVGWIVGSTIKSETWASLAGDIATVGIAPRGNAGLGLTIKVRF